MDRSSGLYWLSQPQQVSPAGTFWQCCSCVEVVHTKKSSLLSLPARGWEADILAVVRRPYISFCTCPLASTESETTAAAAKNAYLTFQELAITITTKLCTFAWCGFTMQECVISLELEIHQDISWLKSNTESSDAKAEAVADDMCHTNIRVAQTLLAKHYFCSREWDHGQGNQNHLSLESPNQAVKELLPLCWIWNTYRFCDLIAFFMQCNYYRDKYCRESTVKGKEKAQSVSGSLDMARNSSQVEEATFLSSVQLYSPASLHLTAIFKCFTKDYHMGPEK
ncbi:hypothetical protein DV515_00004584 [Chloebia gouldiae]|uniref:Uncharacterized protein n=1 Tax=Chloebia gouldiae TaxID=44316 RepID=A0A3L8SQ04_CHLGU|nr:hypothetical protein DV515_00004584 [Chloebia gouldiae]